MPEWLKRLLRPIYFFVFRLRGYPGLRIVRLPITRIEKEFGEVRTYYFRRPEELAFRAGQYVHVIAPNAHLSNHTVRHMSFASAPSEAEIAISMDLSSRSRFKLKFARAKVGDSVGFHSVRGEFTRDEAMADKPLLFIAGGIGIAPIRAHIVELKERGQDWSLIYAGRDYLYRSEWRDCPGKVSFVGRDTLFRAIDAAAPRAGQICFVCGGSGFVDAVRGHLRTLGVGDDDIRTEKFDH